MPNIVPFPTTAEELLLHKLWDAGDTYCEITSHKKYRNCKVLFNDLMLFIKDFRGKTWDGTVIASHGGGSVSSLAEVLSNQKEATYDGVRIDGEAKRKAQLKLIASNMKPNTQVITADNLLAFITAYDDFVKYDGKLLGFNARDINLIETLTRVINTWKANPPKPNADVKDVGSSSGNADGKSAALPPAAAAKGTAVPMSAAPSSTPVMSAVDSAELIALRQQVVEFKAAKEAAEKAKSELQTDMQKKLEDAKAENTRLAETARSAEQKLAEATTKFAAELKAITEKQLAVSTAQATASAAAATTSAKALEVLTKRASDTDSTTSHATAAPASKSDRAGKADGYQKLLKNVLGTPKLAAVFEDVLKEYYKVDHEKRLGDGGKEALRALHDSLLEYTLTKSMRGVTTDFIGGQWKAKFNKNTAVTGVVDRILATHSSLADSMKMAGSIPNADKYIANFRHILKPDTAIPGYIIPNQDLSDKIGTANREPVAASGLRSRTGSLSEDTAVDAKSGPGSRRGSRDLSSAQPPLPSSTPLKPTLASIPASPATAGGVTGIAAALTAPPPTAVPTAAPPALS